MFTDYYKIVTVLGVRDTEMEKVITTFKKHNTSIKRGM